MTQQNLGAISQDRGQPKKDLEKNKVSGTIGSAMRLRQTMAPTTCVCCCPAEEFSLNRSLSAVLGPA